MPKAIWDAQMKQQGPGGTMARQALAFYSIGENAITVIPWTIGGYQDGTPEQKSRQEWIHELESIIIHELMHALHHQNFYVVLGGGRAASGRAAGQTEQEIDEAVVEFLTAEGMAELVSVRVATEEARRNLLRRPARELSAPDRFWVRYQPDGKQPFRLLLSQYGYQDGLDLLHKLSLKGGPRALRGILYRQPPRSLFFQPELLAAVDLDDPPEPDSVFAYLSPELPEGNEVRLAVNPGENRFFAKAYATPGGPRTCLVGYVAILGETGEDSGRGRYAFFVSDPDAPGTWSAEQVTSLKALYPTGASEKTKPLPMLKGVEAKLLTIKAEDGSLYIRGEAAGLVVLAHESNPTKNLEERVLGALRVLHIKRPTPKLYDVPGAAAQKKLDEGLR
jgi:hypothetical protein